MKALAKLERAPGLTMTDVKKPDVGHNDVMIKIKKTAICGTDIHIWKWDEWAQKTIPVPMHVGHEYVGHIVEMGAEVRGFEIGDRVSGEGHITCGHCRNCRAGRRHLCRNTVGVGVNREGSFAEFLVIPAFNAFKIPDLRRKIIFTVLMLLVFRVIAHIPVPGVDLARMDQLLQENQLLGMLNLFSGSALRQFSIAAMGVYPYIT
ncbi:MAG: alcohol dehydrogenase catalytic domain-containing protein, partial [Burkholderiales bacterium]|nr:alcohol dehydrogenase catalytic domain-containing protein [Burkholderiales bacterium]